MHRVCHWKPWAILRGCVSFRCLVTTDREISLYEPLANALNGPYKIIEETPSRIVFRYDLGWLSTNFDPLIYFSKLIIQGELDKCSVTRYIDIDASFVASGSALFALSVVASLIMSSGGINFFTALALTLLLLSLTLVIMALALPRRLSRLLRAELLR